LVFILLIEAWIFSMAVSIIVESVMTICHVDHNSVIR
jgi:hypothetical protein